MLMIMVGVAFKLSAVPFHFWAPDVYQEAPAPVAGLIASASKVASFTKCGGRRRAATIKRRWRSARIYARMPFTTLAGSTPVRRWSRPWNL